MKKSFLSLMFLLGGVVLLGGGCLSFSGSSDVVSQFSVWKTVDGTLTWQKMSVYPTPQGMGDISSVQVYEMIFDPSDKFAMYIGSQAQGLFYTYDGAASWMRVREPYLREGRIRSIAVDPHNKCVYYVSKGQKVSKTIDCGRTFDTEIFVDPRTNITFTDLEIDWFNSNVIYLANTAGEILRSSDGGGTWVTIYRGGRYMTDLEISNADSRIVMGATQKRGIVRSIDGGQNWESVLTDGYESLKGSDEVQDIVQTRDGETIWVSTAYGLLVSNDRGETFGAVPLLTPPASSSISALAVDPNDGNHVVYVVGHTIYTTMNSGERWETEKMPVGAEATQLLIDPEDSSTVYMGVKAFVQK